MLFYEKSPPYTYKTSPYMYKAPPYMYDWVLNASLLLGELYYSRLFQQHKRQRKNNTVYYNLNYNSILGSVM